MQYHRRRAMHPPTPGRAASPTPGPPVTAPALARLLGSGPPQRELDALLVALHFEGGRLDTLLGLLQAAQKHCLAIASDRPMVVLPAYGSTHGSAETVALLALALARDGHQVLVHGPLSDAGRMTPAAVLGALGLPPARGAPEVQAAWARREPAFVPIERLCPPLATLLERRLLLGVRGPADLVASMLRPAGAPRVLHVMHQDDEAASSRIRDWAARVEADVVRAGLGDRGYGGLRRPARLEVMLSGQPRPDLLPAADADAAALAPLATAAHQAGAAPDAAATSARCVQELLSGARSLPAAPQRVLDAAASALAALSARPQPIGSALY
ncbi:MAG: hypothetical protein ACK5UM_11420 [Pseudomonadota bacterium]|jgi:hypothetical protein|nr:hypothetical protein [Rubrivivax sp.]MCA3258640.1 hypothetical protein [Rubrivivax sp.]MCE2913744.1 hypothetical protein [Rubrivivax sp.]MCZ8030215.1 hypothetical protein [Rubrivivax sp.]